MGRESTIWIATVRTDGRPHLTPVWYVWLDGYIYIATGTDTQKYTNLRGNRTVALALPDTERVIIVEGEAHATNQAKTDDLGNHFFNKYEWDFRYDESADWRLVEIKPRKILAWGDSFEAEGIRVL